MIQIYDSLRGEKVTLDKQPGETVRMYVCGPTVYDHAHLGHGRSAVAFDLVRRFLEVSSYEVIFTFNTTDIDDKMIDRAAKEGITVDELAEKIIPEYKADYGALGVKTPTHNPRATEYVEPMVELIKTLEAKGHTYVLSDGVYFDIKTFKDYGKLSHQNLDELNAGARVEERTDKRNHQDFVLWKFKKEGEPFWPSPWGDGRPGWHIECSAMSATLLGETFDIHGGGLDLKFPHHECEIAQSEAANGKTFANIWMHNGYITVDQEKMSKSLGNFFTLKEIFKQYNPRVVRFFLLGTHYRSPIEYSLEMLEQARSTLKSLDHRYLSIKYKKTADHEPWAKEFVNRMMKQVKERLEDDFDVAGALTSIHSLFGTDEDVGKASQPILRNLIQHGGLCEEDKIILLEAFQELNQIFNVFPVDFSLSPDQENLIAARDEARAAKDWEKSDELRDQLTAQGIDVEDSATGTFAKPRI